RPAPADVICASAEFGPHPTRATPSMPARPLPARITQPSVSLPFRIVSSQLPIEGLVELIVRPLGRAGSLSKLREIAALDERHVHRDNQDSFYGNARTTDSNHALGRRTGS